MPKTSIDPGVWQLKFSPPEEHGSTPAGRQKKSMDTKNHPSAAREKNM
jgi:hypothetical protein